MDPFHTIDATNGPSDTFKFQMPRRRLQQNVRRVPHETICTSNDQNPDQDCGYRIQPGVAGEYHHQATDYHSNRRDSVSDSMKEDPLTLRLVFPVRARSPVVVRFPMRPSEANDSTSGPWTRVGCWSLRNAS